MENRLKNKVAIITGGASGIGEATARRFMEHGARAVVIADIQEEKGQKVAESIDSDDDHDRCIFIKCDVTDEEQVKSLVESTIKIYGQLDIMFSNAGIASGSNQDILNFDLNDCDNLFAVNVRGTIACVKHAGRAMVEGGKGGSIICTASLAAVSTETPPTFIDYVMSKHSVIGLVRCASKGLGQYGIRVNCVAPGLVATPMACNTFRMSVEEMEQNFEPSFVLKGKEAMKAKHIADAVVFLASDDSEFVTGHNLVVDGGYCFGENITSSNK